MFSSKCPHLQLWSLKQSCKVKSFFRSQLLKINNVNMGTQCYPKQMNFMHLLEPQVLKHFL